MDAIERKYPSKEVKALVAEIRRLNTIVIRAGDVLNHLDKQPRKPLDSVSVAAMRMIEILRALLEEQPTGKRRTHRTD